MNIRILPNLDDAAQVTAGRIATAPYTPRKSEPSLWNRAVRYLQHRLDAAQQSYQREAEIRKAIRHLQVLTDEQLMDMGITRLDIVRVVRHGKEAA